MGQFLVVSKVDLNSQYNTIAREFGVGFEYNDFYMPGVLSSAEKINCIRQQYFQTFVPDFCTLHGAFFDVTVFSEDEEIQRISKLRMKQSMDAGQAMGVNGVVFHTNINPFLSSNEYNTRVINMTVEYMEELLTHYPEQRIYLENMFDSDPSILLQISERLSGYPNYGVCLDYSHAGLSKVPVSEWVHTLHSYVRHIHINDHDGRQDLHLAIGDGVTDWLEFKEHYRQYFMDCSVLIETADPEWQIRSIRFLKQLGVMEK